LSESRGFSRPRQSLATVGVGKARDSALDFTRTLRVTADNLDSVGVDLVRVVELEVDILDDERPDIVAETVGIEVTLERQASFDLVSKPVRNRFVEVDEDLHGQLGLDSALGDQVVERVCEGTAQTVLCQPRHSTSLPRRRMQYLLRRYSS
jgi:hypothetical protein